LRCSGRVYSHKHSLKKKKRKEKPTAKLSAPDDLRTHITKSMMSLMKPGLSESTVKDFRHEHAPFQGRTSHRWKVISRAAHQKRMLLVTSFAVCGRQQDLEKEEVFWGTILAELKTEIN